MFKKKEPIKRIYLNFQLKLNDMIKNSVSMISLILLLTSCSLEQNGILLESPSGISSFSISRDAENDNQIMFSVNYYDNIVITPSPIEVTIVNEQPIGKNLQITSIKKKSVSENWERVWGKSRNVENRYNEAIIKLTETIAPYRKFQIIARAYDDGIAFRYKFPESYSTDSLFIVEENTVFNFNNDYNVWATKLQGYVSSQERLFEKRRISELSDGAVYGTPVLVQLDNGWAALLEANLTDWAGMYIAKDPNNENSVKTLLSPRPDRENISVITTPPANTPWRVIMLAKKPGDLIVSNLLHNLNEPNKIENTSWIKPGRSAWDPWWSGGYGPDFGRKLDYDNESMKYFIDLASEMGWEYQLVDWLWYGEPFAERWDTPDPMSDITKSDPRINIPELVEYAAKKNVKLLLWTHYWHLDRQMEEAFKLYNEWGIKGVKVDFMNRNDQEIVNFYHRVLQTAAKYELGIVFHGSYMPTGIDRTYPNSLSKEGVMGNEFTKWGNNVTPKHCVTIPFTRMLGGQLDFTPGGFNHAPFGTFIPSGADAENPRVQGTRCFQLAMPVIYESALTIFCDSPDNYRGANGIDFYRLVPTTWDESKVIDGFPGEFITMARKNGDDWFIGSMNNETEREVIIPLDFLDSGVYEASIYLDAEDVDKNPSNLIKEVNKFNKQDTLVVKLAKGGGMAAHFKSIP
jgi:alpha-glucosidase